MTIGTTNKGQPIAAWMVKGNPDKFDVGSYIADIDGEEEGTWSLFQTYRVDLIDEGQPVLLWVTAGGPPELEAGIWLVGETTGQASSPRSSTSSGWHDQDMADEERPYMPAIFRTLAQPILRRDLVDHPVLRDLEVLRSPAMSNPQIVTPEQLEALRTDFGLEPGPLPDDVRQAISTDYAELVVLGEDGRLVCVYVYDEDAMLLVDGDDQATSYETWQEAYREAAALATENGPILDEAGGTVPIVECMDATIVVVRVGEDVYRVWEEDDGVTEWAASYSSVSEAVEDLIEHIESQLADERPQ